MPLGTSLGLQVQTQQAAWGDVTGTISNQGDLWAYLSRFTSNIGGVAIVDMLTADYTMTDAESICSVIILTNVGDGTKTAYFPTSTDAARPVVCQVLTFFAAKPVTLARQSGGASTLLNINSAIAIDNITSGVYNATAYYNIQARNRLNAFITEATTARTTSDTDAGSLIKCTNAALTTVTVNSTNSIANYMTTVYAAGAAGVSIIGDGTSVVTGNTTLATKQSCRIIRDGSSNNFLCV